MVFVGTGGAVATAPGPATDAGASTWAYAGVRTVSFGNNLTHEITGVFGYSVELSEGTPVGSTIPITVTRTMGAKITVVVCVPDCKAPAAVYNATYHAWETSTTTAELTTAATVLESAGAVPAIGLNNSSTSDAAFVRDSTQTEVGGTITHYQYLSVNASADTSVAFATPLGLFPTNLTVPAAWNSSATYAASGSYLTDWYYAQASGLPLHGGGNGSVSRTGLVTVAGTYNGTSFSYGGASFPAIQLTVAGPFTAREGFILVPSAADLFSSSSQTWTGDQSSTAAVAQGALDARASYDGHLGIIASEWVWNSASVDSTAAAPISGPGPAVNTAPAASNQPVIVQGQPVSAQQAQSDSGCLVNGSGCPSLGGSTSGHPFLGLLLVAGIVIVVAVASVVLVSERRRSPPPKYPNATLYPPGAGTTSAPAHPPDAPPPEEDPLGHLW